MGSYNYTISIGHLGEQLTLNQWVLGSSPRWCTKKIPRKKLRGIFYCCFPESRSLVRRWWREQLVYFRLSKKLLLGRALLARARLPVKQLPRKKRCCVKSAGDHWSPLHIQWGKNMIF